MTSKARIDKGMYWDRAWSLVEGCTPISPGCQNCWSAAATHMRSTQTNPRIRARYEGLTVGVAGGDNGIMHKCQPRFIGTVRPQWDALDLPFHVKKPTTFAVWNDLFHKDVPFGFWRMVLSTMLATNMHTYLVLTKRAHQMAVSTGALRGQWPPHVWFGVTAENQTLAEERIAELMRVDGNRWLSVEPLLGPVDLRPYLDHLQWVVCGPETGKHKRPCDPAWIADLHKQCQAAGVQFFDKRKEGWLARQLPEGV